MKDYKTIFEGIESTLISVGSKNLPVCKIKEYLDQYKHFENKVFSNNDYYWELAKVIFYTGMTAATITKRLDTIHDYFDDYETASDYSDHDIKEMLTDKNMICNKNKIQGCIDNARIFRRIIKEYGSFKKYIESFVISKSFKNLMLLREDLRYRFWGLGPVTSYHFLMEIGLPVLKPDRVIIRIFQRLGLIENTNNDEQFLNAINQGREFAQVMGYPIRYIDIVFVHYGQMKSVEAGIEKGICLETNPSCKICGVTNYCNYYAQNSRLGC